MVAQYGTGFDLHDSDTTTLLNSAGFCQFDAVVANAIFLASAVCRRLNVGCPLRAFTHRQHSAKGVVHGDGSSNVKCALGCLPFGEICTAFEFDAVDGCHFVFLVEAVDLEDVCEPTATSGRVYVLQG